MPGYSGTPLAKKLGLRPGSDIVTIGAPAHYRSLLDPVPPDVRFGTRVSTRTHVVHVFCDKRAHLAATLARLRRVLAPEAAVWVSWPKRASGVPTDITEDVIREVALPLGWVDIKVCAVDATWSGLKLVVRKELRGDAPRVRSVGRARKHAS